MKQTYTKTLLILIHLFMVHLFADDNNQPIEKDTKEIQLTILVHGIISVKPHLSVSNVVKFVRDKIANTTYARSIERTRRNPFFFQHHPMQGLGLRKIDIQTNEKGAASTACAQLFNMIEAYSGKSIHNEYYTFGWSGLLSPKMRYLEAKIFYDQILKEFEPYFQNDKSVKIRIIGYSHGGNIALRLAEVYKREGYLKKHKLKIDELILMGAPVLPETDYLINSSIFKKVYHFYSYGDRIQRLDFFSLDRVFSNRKFHERSDFAIPDKLVQINVKVKRIIANSHKNVKAQQQEDLHKLLHRRSVIRNADPGHTELWSFGWSPSSYRQNFPLNPLPLTVFAPYTIEQINKNMPETKNLMVELHPHYEHILLYDYDHKAEKITPFLKKTQLDQLKQHAELFRPDNYNRKKFDKKINKAIKVAREEHFTQWKNRRRLNRQKRARMITTSVQAPTTLENHP